MLQLLYSIHTTVYSNVKTRRRQAFSWVPRAGRHRTTTPFCDRCRPNWQTSCPDRTSRSLSAPRCRICDASCLWRRTLRRVLTYIVLYCTMNVPITGWNFLVLPLYVIIWKCAPPKYGTVLYCTIRVIGEQLEFVLAITSVFTDTTDFNVDLP